MRWWLLAIAFIGTVAWLRVSTSAVEEWDRAIAAEQQGDLEMAIDHYQYAVRWYTPFSSTPRNAADALERLALQARQNGNTSLALRAYRRLRGAILATRGLFSPFEARRDAVNTALAELTADQQLAAGGPTVRSRKRSQLVKDHRALLALDPIPSRLWSLAVILSFAAWVLGAFATIRRGFDENAKIQRRAFSRWGMFTALSFGFWMLGLYNA